MPALIQFSGKLNVICLNICVLFAKAYIACLDNMVSFHDLLLLFFFFFSYPLVKLIICGNQNVRNDATTNFPFPIYFLKWIKQKKIIIINKKS